ncbi:DoxX family protein [Sulfurimonas sp. SAG-AH-194-C21]|nr:DoxX family protein [Sulfurimonas sp. SAG-AH-194-C21]MDF1884099.1 DoxX family protein [Sulfurimonas sp. SAG-AH-194-C21]
MCIKDIYKEFTCLSEYSKSLGLLGLRLILAYTFFAPAMMKWNDIGSVVQWFDYMGIPFPTLNAYMAAGTEMAGVVLLTLGLLTRFISIPLIVIMFVAIATVHGVNGFAFVNEAVSFTDAYVNGTEVKGTLIGLQNGYELVLYYTLMLFVLVGSGAGKFSFDRLIFGEKN